MCDDTKISNLIHNFDEESDLKSDFYLFLIYGFPWEKQGFYWKYNKIYGFLYLAKVKILVSIRANSKSKLIFYYLVFYHKKNEIWNQILFSFKVRKIRDSNPRYSCPYTCTPNMRFRPLSQSSCNKGFIKKSEKIKWFSQKKLVFCFHITIRNMSH